MLSPFSFKFLINIAETDSSVHPQADQCCLQMVLLAIVLSSIYLSSYLQRSNLHIQTNFYLAPTMCKKVLEIEWRQESLSYEANNRETSQSILLGALQKSGYTILCAILRICCHVRKMNEALLFADFVLATNDRVSPENGIHHLSFSPFIVSK